jgi:hypothetical protein
MKWWGHITRMGENMNTYMILVGKPRGKRPRIDLDVGGSIILRLIVKINDWVLRAGLGWLRIRIVGQLF